MNLLFGIAFVVVAVALAIVCERLNGHGRRLANHGTIAVEFNRRIKANGELLSSLTSEVFELSRGVSQLRNDIDAIKVEILQIEEKRATWGSAYDFQIQKLNARIDSLTASRDRLQAALNPEPQEESEG